MTRLAFRTALALAEWLAPDGVGEALAGDLLERHATRHWGGWHALCELLRSLPALLGWRIRSAGPAAMDAAGLAFVGTRLATSAFWGYLLYRKCHSGPTTRPVSPSTSCSSCSSSV